MVMAEQNIVYSRNYYKKQLSLPVDYKRRNSNEKRKKKKRKEITSPTETIYMARIKIVSLYLYIDYTPYRSLERGTCFNQRDKKTRLAKRYKIV